MPVNVEVESTPSLVLDEDCMNPQDLSNSLMGRVKEFATLSNLKMGLANEGFDNIEIKYLGEFWVLLKFSSEESKNLFHANVGVGTWFSQLQQASMDFIIDGRVTWVEIEGIPFKMWSVNTFKRIASKWGVVLHVDDQEDGFFWIRATEVPGWVPDFMEDNKEECDNDCDTKEGDSKGKDVGLKSCSIFEEDSDVEEVPETKLEENQHKSKWKRIILENSLKYPPGFTSTDDTKEQGKKNDESRKESGECSHKGSKKGSREDVAESICSGKVVIMGDFNEVRKKTERFGSVFNMQGANAFNLFIAKADLEEVPLGGSSFTCDYLRPYLYDHRPILLRESQFDYGPIPFRFFHYWFEMEGFDKLVEDTWKEAPVEESNAKSAKNSKTIFKEELADLDMVIDKGEGNAVVVNKRMGVVKSLQDLEKLQSLEAAQKAKIKWAIEGD
ncbi:RNA-directed DNA polymerase, eukaryota, partial [Tanacetum coccineum]